MAAAAAAGRSRSTLADFLTESVYNEHPSIDFKEKLKRCILEARDACRFSPSPTSLVVRYDPLLLRDCLGAVHWKKLCGTYEERKKSSVEISLLSVTLECFGDCTVWPFADDLFAVLWDVLIGLAGKRSRKVLLKFLTQQLEQTSCLLGPPNLLRLIDLDRVRTIAHAKAVLSACKHWFLEFPDKRAMLLSKMMELIAVLDHLESSVEVGKRDDTLAGADQEGTQKQRADAFNMECLHGELSEEQEMALSLRLIQRQKFPPSKPAMKLKDVMMHRQTTNGCSLLLVELWKLKAACTKAFLTACRKTVDGWSRKKPIPRCIDPVSTIFQLLLDMACQFPNAPSVRLCGVMLAEAALKWKHNSNAGSTSAPYQSLVQQAWRRVTELEVVDSIFYLRYYSELLTECSYFDDPDHLFLALAPIVELIKRPLPVKFHERRAVRCYLQSFAFILSRRGNMLMAWAATQSNHAYACTFTSLLARLSLTLDSPTDWIEPGTPVCETERQIQALQLAGILGMCASNSIDNPVEQKSHVFPFPLLNAADQTSIRTVAMRVSPWLPSPLDEACKLFSRYSPTNTVSPHAISHRKQQQTSSHSEPSPCLQNYLNDDLMLHVFSFHNHKRLSQMRRVSSSWRACADSNRLWQSLYDAKYGTESDDPLLLQEYIDWKQHFVHRCQVQHDIRFRVYRRDPRWRVRVCGYVGCLEVLATPVSLKRHYERHRRQHHQAARRALLVSKRAQKQKNKESSHKRQKKKHATPKL